MVAFRLLGNVLISVLNIWSLNDVFTYLSVWSLDVPGTLLVTGVQTRVNLSVRTLQTVETNRRPGG